jgi:diguanylate cyclase (GGDEF)-like protein
MAYLVSSDRLRRAVRAATVRRAVAASIAAALVLVVAFTAITTLAGWRPPGSTLDGIDRWVRNAASLTAGLICLARATVIRYQRLPWALLGAGLTAYGIGTIYYYTTVINEVPPPFPSWSDAFWLTFYPLVATALVLMMGSRIVSLHPSLLLDALVGGLGVAALTGGLASVTVEHIPSGNLTAVAVSMIYPLADLTLLVLVVSGFGLMRWRPGRGWWLMGLSVALFALADSYILYRVSTGGYTPGGMVDVGWEVALLLPAFAALSPTQRRGSEQVAGWAVLWVPVVLALAALGLLVTGTVIALPTVTVVLATATVLCAFARGALTFGEVRHLARSRVEARTDDLTGLGNRRAFNEQLAAWGDRDESAARFAILVLDLDRFKEVNDALGHHAGDRLLTQVGKRIGTVLRAGDLLSRLGGDEYALLLPGSSVDDGVAVADRIRDVLSPVFDIDGMALHVNASIGVAGYPEHAKEATSLLRRADVAMYAAKSGRTGVERYQVGTDSANLLRLTTVEALHDALGKGLLRIHFQPQFDLRTGASDAVEALVRWQHPTRGLLPPDAFVPLAEHSGLIRPMTREVLDLSMLQCRAWWDAGLRITVAVNLSASSLLDATFPDQVRQVITRHGLPPTALELEVTETTLMLDRVRSALVLSELRELGVRIAVDDYGTGYSSLAYLRDLPVDVLKLDKVFVHGLETDSVARAIVRHTVALAHALGLRVVAEGVERPGTLDRLRQLGCDYAQGFLLGYPEPAELLTGKLRLAYRPDAAADLAAATEP